MKANRSPGNGILMAFCKAGATLLLACTPVLLAAQDIHFTQFFNAPLSNSPANIGQFDGDYRLNGIYRQQWRSVTTPYRTFGFGGDASNFLQVQGLGAGAWLYNDRAGDSRLNTFHFDLGSSWTERFGNAQQHALTGGVQLGITTISIDYSDLQFDAQYNGYYFDPSLDRSEQFPTSSSTHADVHAGIQYQFRKSRREQFSAGFAFFNLTRPSIGFQGGPGVPLNTRTVFTTTGQFPVSEKVDVLPMIQYMTQAKFREFNIGGIVRYILLDQYGLNRAVQFGAFHRAADAGNLYAGLEHDDWTFGISYDLNFSDLVPASNNRGAWEISAIYIIRKRPAVPVRFKACPDQL